MMLRGNKAIVTGASRGLGFAIAKALHENGCKVLITGRNEETLRRAAAEIGEDVIPCVWDMEKLVTLQASFERAAELLGGCDILVNNAGVISSVNEWDREELINFPLKEWQRVMDVNTNALFLAMQAAVRYMRGHGIRGNVLNVTSVASQEPAFGPYSTSKAASFALTRGWGKMFAPEGIVINGIAPGPFATSMNNWKEGDPMDHPRIPFGRFGKPEEVAALAMHLLSKEGEMICGETVIIDGAYAIR